MDAVKKVSDPRTRTIEASTGPAAKLRCPVVACHMGPDANIYRFLLVGPDGQQRAGWGCVKHVGLELSRALSAIRIEPFE